MEIKNAGYALFVRDIEVSKKIYVDTLKQQIDLDFGKNIILKGGITLWEINEKHIIPSLLGTNTISNTDINRFEMYFETENLDEVYKALKEKNTKFLHEIHEEPWGQYTIRFFDPDNHLIEVGESMFQFVTRFYKTGMTAKEVSIRTSVPVEEVKRIIGKIN